MAKGGEAALGLPTSLQTGGLINKIFMVIKN